MTLLARVASSSFYWWGASVEAYDAFIPESKACRRPSFLYVFVCEDASKGFTLIFELSRINSVICTMLRYIILYIRSYDLPWLPGSGGAERMTVPGSIFRAHPARSIDYTTYYGRAQWPRWLSPRPLFGDLFLFFVLNDECLARLLCGWFWCVYGWQPILLLLFQWSTIAMISVTFFGGSGGERGGKGEARPLWTIWGICYTMVGGLESRVLHSIDGTFVIHGATDSARKGTMKQLKCPKKVIMSDVRLSVLRSPIFWIIWQ